MQVLMKMNKCVVGALVLVGCIMYTLTVIKDNSLVDEINRIKYLPLRGLITDKEHDQLEEQMKERADELRQRCIQLLRNNHSNVNAGKAHILLKGNSYILCNVPKCGSTYWAQVLLTMSGHLNRDYFENNDREYIHAHTWKIAYKKRDAYSIADSTLILTTRNPWHRIYSAYMDKIFRLQFHFEKKVQRMLGERGKYSGTIPTFQQFLTYIISSHQNGHALDPHWRPISNQCQVCRYNYTYVLKMESFVGDSMFLLSELFHNNINESHAFYLYLTQKHDNDEILKLVRHFTVEYRQMRNIFNFTDTMKRLWTSFQSQGLLSDEVAFNDHLFENMSSDNVSEIVDIFNSKRNEKILSPAQKRQQRQKHFKDAYSKIDDSILKGIQEIYANDFLLFSYDPDIKTYL